jgi:hypothetical protein
MTVGGLVDTVFRFNRLRECHLYTAPRNICLSPSLQCPVQAGSGDLECPANIHYRVAVVVELPSNTPFLYSEDFWPAAFFPSWLGLLLILLVSVPE